MGSTDNAARRSSEWSAARWIRGVLSLAAHDLTHRMAWATAMFLVVFTLGTIGLILQEYTVLESAYGGLQLFGVNGNASWLASSKRGSYLVAVSAFLAPFITLGLLSIMVARVVAFVRRIPVAHGDHVVVIGGGRVGFQWVKAFRAQANPPSRIIVVDPTPDQHVLNLELLESPRAVMPRCMTLQLDARSKESRALCKLDRARAVVVCTGQDLANLEIASGIPMSAAGPVVFCRIDAPDLLATRPKDTGLHYFSFYQWVARRTLARVVSLPGGPSGEAFHLVIAGFGHFGQAVLRAALTDYFAKIAQISVVDKDAAELLEAFRFAAPAEWNGPLASAVARQQNLLNASLWKEFNVGASQLPIHIWVCTDNDRTNLTWAASVRRHVDQHVKCVIVCRQTEDAPESELSIHFASFETSDISGEIHDLLNASGA